MSTPTTEPESTPEPTTGPAPKTFNPTYAIFGLAVLSGILYWGFTREQPAEPPPAPEQAEVSPLPAVPVEPEPAPEAVSETAVEPAEPTPLPPALPTITLEEANEALLADIDQLGAGVMGEQFAAAPNALERGVAIVDSFRLGEVPHKLLPVGRPKTPFGFIDDGTQVTMDPAGFARYDGLITALERVDVQAAVSLYDQYGPALDQAWTALGYTDTSLEDSLMGALGLILTAPETDLNARLIKQEANWVYEDEALENLPALQKQIMRMGPDNAERIQAVARALRGALLDRPQD